MRVRDLMTSDVRTCLPQANLNDVARAMWEGDCGCVPVIDETRRVVGMLTDRDLCMAAYTQGRPLSGIPASAAMARQVVSCQPDDELAAAERSMQKAQVRRLPVVNADGRLAGILSLNDLARQASRERAQKTRAVGVDEVATTLAAVCEPRPRKAAPVHEAKRATSLLAVSRSDQEC